MNRFLKNAQDKLNTVKPEPFKIYECSNECQQIEFINNVEYFKWNYEHHKIWYNRFIDLNGEVKLTMSRKNEFNS
jgi:hypothetical protein